MGVSGMEVWGEILGILDPTPHEKIKRLQVLIRQGLRLWASLRSFPAAVKSIEKTERRPCGAAATLGMACPGVKGKEFGERKWFIHPCGACCAYGFAGQPEGQPRAN